MPDLAVPNGAKWGRGEHRRLLTSGKPCRHDCRHHVTGVVARSPDGELRELIECWADVLKGGCGGGCRAWSDGDGRITTRWLDLTHAEAK